MILRVNLTSTNEVLPFDYADKMLGYLHKVIGKNNEYHDTLSNYQISFLRNGKFDKKVNGLKFNNNPFFYVASLDMNFLTLFAKNIYKYEDFIYGMKLVSVENVPEEITNIKKIGDDTYKIPLETSLLLKENVDNKTKFFTFKDNDEIVSRKLKQILMKGVKINNLNIKPEDFSICFDHTYTNKKTKMDYLKGIKNISSFCPLILKTKNEEVLKLIKNFGLGNSRGCGFGFVL